MSNQREVPYRMRRLTDAEIAHICEVAAVGNDGGAKAMAALWDLILTDAEGVTWTDAVERGLRFDVSAYSIEADQGAAIHAAVTDRPDLPRSVRNGLVLMWLDQSPAEHGERSDPHASGG